jgi:urease accessory protein UreH
MCSSFFATSQLLAQANLEISNTDPVALVFDERQIAPKNTDGFLVKIRVIADDCADYVLMSRQQLNAADFATNASMKMSEGSLFSYQELFVRGSFANGETLYFLASTTNVSIAYSIEAVQSPFNREALA